MTIQHKNVTEMPREELEMIVAKFIELDNMEENENPQRQNELVIEIQNLVRVPMIEVSAVTELLPAEGDMQNNEEADTDTVEEAA